MPKYREDLDIGVHLGKLEGKRYWCRVMHWAKLVEAPAFAASVHIDRSPRVELAHCTSHSTRLPKCVVRVEAMEVRWERDTGSLQNNLVGCMRKGLGV